MWQGALWPAGYCVTACRMRLKLTSGRRHKTPGKERITWWPKKCPFNISISFQNVQFIEYTSCIYYSQLIRDITHILGKKGLEVAKRICSFSINTMTLILASIPRAKSAPNIFFRGKLVIHLLQNVFLFCLLFKKSKSSQQCCQLARPNINDFIWKKITRGIF